MMTEDQIIEWLLQGDSAIQYQVYRDLLGEDRNDIQSLIETDGWGAEYLGLRKASRKDFF